MDYPSNFDTSTFPAGKTIALSRTVSIWTAIVFFLIFCACGFVLLVTKYKTNYPFLISIDPITYDWSVIAYPKQNKKTDINQYQIIQERLVKNYVTNWFTISNDPEINGQRWLECSIDDCKATEQFKPGNIKCALSCSSDEKLYEQFAIKVLPEYHERIKQANETWTVGDMQILPTSISENSSKWQVIVTINSSITSQFVVLVFIDINRNPDLYPANLGYYVQDFNAYRINR